MRWLLDEVVQLAREREDLWDRWRKLHQDRERAQIALKATGRHGRVNEILGLAERGRPRKIPADLGRKICALPLDADLEQEMQNIATEAGVEFDTVHRKVRGELAALAESGDRAAREALARLPARPWSEDGKKKKS
jgi:hypothetical protein